MKKTLLLPFFLLTMTSFHANAQNDPKQMSTYFFDLYANGKTSEAVDYIFTTNKWMTDSKDQIENVKQQLLNTAGQLGTYYGYGMAVEKKIGDNIIYYSFIVRYDRLPLRFNFTFYKANEKWALNNFSFDDNISKLIEITN